MDEKDVKGMVQLCAICLRTASDTEHDFGVWCGGAQWAFEFIAGAFKRGLTSFESCPDMPFALKHSRETKSATAALIEAYDDWRRETELTAQSIPTRQAMREMIYKLMDEVRSKGDK